jgi:hypothetical protein
MNNSKLDRLFRPIAKRLQENHMFLLGIANTMRLAHYYNRLRFGRQDKWRRSLYRTQLRTLLEENGSLTRRPIEMMIGYTAACRTDFHEVIMSRNLGLIELRLP